MIQITCGTCGTSQGYKTKNDGALTLSAAEERRLVARGVAEYVTRPIITPDTSVAMPGGGKYSDGASATHTEHSPASTNQETSDSEDEDTAELQEGEAEAGDVLEIVDGHFTTESLMTLTRPNMEELAANMGVDVSKCKNKGDIAVLLATIEVQTGGEAPPELGAEGPVV